MDRELISTERRSREAHTNVALYRDPASFLRRPTAAGELWGFVSGRERRATHPPIRTDIIPVRPEGDLFDRLDEPHEVIPAEVAARSPVRCPRRLRDRVRMDPGPDISLTALARSSHQRGDLPRPRVLERSDLSSRAVRDGRAAHLHEPGTRSIVPSATSRRRARGTSQHGRHRRPQ